MSAVSEKGPPHADSETVLPHADVGDKEESTQLPEKTSDSKIQGTRTTSRRASTSKTPTSPTNQRPESSASKRKTQKIGAAGNSSNGQETLREPRHISIEEPSSGALLRSTEKAGTVLGEELERLEGMATITARKSLAFFLTGFILACMAAYFVYMMIVQDKEGLSNFITVLVGILGIITGHYFGEKREHTKGDK
jgi:hypothetical protein